MNTMSLNVMAVRPGCVWRWAEAKQRLTMWRINTRSRNELMSLSDRCLQDIGVSRCTAEFEAAKPFWMA